MTEKITSSYASLYNLLIECCRNAPDSVKLEILAGNIADWAEFLDSAYVHGVFPLVYKSLKSVASIPDDVKLYLKSTNLEIARRNMTMTAELLKIMKLLEENDISALAIKGPILSQMIYGDITQRQFSDLDILIQEKDLYNSVELLAQHEYVFEHPIKFLKNKTLLNTEKDIALKKSSNNIYVEMHWRLFVGRLFKKTDISLFRVFPHRCLVQGSEVATLDKEVLILYLLLHGSKHLWERIEWIVDIDRLIRTDDNLSWEKILQWAETMEIKPMIYFGIMVSHTLFLTPFPEKVVDMARQNPNIVKAVDGLIEQIYTNHIHNINPSMNNYYFFGLKGFKYKIYKILSTFHEPSTREIYFVNLPTWLSPLYYFILLFNTVYTQVELWWREIVKSEDVRRKYT